MVPPYRHSGADIAFWVMIGLFALGEYAVQFRSFRAAIRGRSGKRAERWSLAAVLVGVIGGFVVASDWQMGTRARSAPEPGRCSALGLY